jgi:hypothetical protein
MVIPIITGKSNISLRILDWFVTNYSKKKNINYQIEDKGKIKNFIVANHLVFGNMRKNGM